MRSCNHLPGACWRLASLVLLACAVEALALDVPVVDVRAYPTLQAAIDANPGRIIQIPPGEYAIDRALRVSHDETEILGPARIIQTNPRESMVRVEKARGVRISTIAFTRSEGNQEAEQAGIEIIQCQDVELSHVRVSDNHTRASILARDSLDVTVQNCTVINYKGLAIDDRTANKLYGYAFKAIDGTGIQFRGVQGGIIRDNRVQEFRLRPTRETRDRYELGALTVVPAERGRLMAQDIFDTKYTNNWHQGSGIHVTTPDRGARILIIGNYIENPAQGIDIHSDNVTVANNIISHAMIGMKAMHGSKHVLIDGNQFTHVDLWGVMLMPGAASHASANAGPGGTVTENVDGGTIVSNNVFSNFGFGDQYWNWEGNKPRGVGRNVIALLAGQLEENPPIRNVLVTGNVVYDSGLDTVMLDGEWTKAAPRFRFALYVELERHPAPVNVGVHGNLFDAGFEGVSNFPEAATGTAERSGPREAAR